MRRFRAEAEQAKSEVRDAANWQQVAVHLRERSESGPVVVAPALAAHSPALLDALAEAGVVVVVPSAGPDGVATEVADRPVGVVHGELAVAETGSVLVSEHALQDRAVSMLCRRLVQVVERRALVASLDDAAEWLATRPRGPDFASLITGPSRTADIERSLTIGVQGPDAVDVVVVG